MPVGLVLLFTLTVFGETPADTTFADFLFRLGFFDDARIEFERQSAGDYDRSKLMVGVCYVKANNIEQSLKLFSIFIDSTDDYVYAQEALSYCVDIELRHGNIDSAMIYLSRGIDSGLFESNDLLVNRLADIFNGDWGETDIEPPRKKSPALANIMSIILPGSGQIYAGKPLEGVRSATVNSVMWYITISGLLQGYYPRAITVFYLLGHRYWLGGADKAGVIATEFNENERKRAYSELAEELEGLCD
ncbi:hypothetical protein DRQ36_06375 [bacterium]|nr:MAG: hypothetical protein DRQ36_06375 [bacterium]